MPWDPSSHTRTRLPGEHRAITIKKRLEWRSISDTKSENSTSGWSAAILVTDDTFLPLPVLEFAIQAKNTWRLINIWSYQRASFKIDYFVVGGTNNNQSNIGLWGSAHMGFGLGQNSSIDAFQIGSCQYLGIDIRVWLQRQLWLNIDLCIWIVSNSTGHFPYMVTITRGQTLLGWTSLPAMVSDIHSSQFAQMSTERHRRPSIIQNLIHSLLP